MLFEICFSRSMGQNITKSQTILGYIRYIDLKGKSDSCSLLHAKNVRSLLDIMCNEGQKKIKHIHGKLLQW